MNRQTTTCSIARIAYLTWMIFFSFGCCFSYGLNDDADLDPVAFLFSSNKAKVNIGEEFELTVTATKRPNWDSRLANTVLDTDFRIKVVFPDGFEQSGGNYSDFIYEKFEGQKTTVVYKIRGKFTREPSSGTFMLLRGTKHSVEIGRYLFRAEIKISILNTHSKEIKNNQRTKASVSCSGYTFSDGQVIGSAGPGNAVVRISSGCTVIYWEGGSASGRTNKDWLPLLSGKSIPDNVLVTCLKWDGDALNCSSVCTTPVAPTITKTSGTTVCSTSSPVQSVTLTATNCSGTVTWYKDGMQVGSGTTLTKSDAGNYTATCTAGTCVSNVSTAFIVSQTIGCGTSGTSINCSGYTFSNGQVIGSGGPGNAVVRISSGCAVVYWEGGSPSGRTNKDWLPLLSGKSIPDNVLLTCLKWDGDALNCSSVCTIPAAPTITKTSGTTVCSSASSVQSITLTATNCSGTVTWYKDGTQVGSETTLTKSDAGSYTATCTAGTCVSNASTAIIVSQTIGCGTSGTSINCSGYTFNNGQVIGSGGPGNAVVRISSGCAVVYWEGGSASGRANKDWLPLLSGKSIPDNVLLTCLKWDGDALNCSSVCTAPAAPTITKTSGTTVCATSSPVQSVTLTATGCSGTVTWSKDGAQVGSGTTLSRSDAGNYTATCTVASCASNPSAAIVISQTSGCGVITSGNTLGAYSKTVGGREFTYSRTPELELQFNADGTITDITPGLTFDGNTNKIDNNRVFYMIGYTVFENADGSYNRLQNLYLPDGIYTIRQFVCNENVIINFDRFKEGLTGWNNGVTSQNSRLSEVFLSIKTINASPSLTITPTWLKVSHNFLFPSVAQQKNWGPFNKFFCLVYQNKGSFAIDYQTLGVNTDLDYSNETGQPNTWNTVRWNSPDPSTMTNQALYDYGKHWIERSGDSQRFLLTDEIPENAQGQDATIISRMFHFYKGAYDRLVSTRGITSKRQTGLYGSYGGDDFSGMIKSDLLKFDRNNFIKSLTTHVHKVYDPATGAWAGDAEYYTSGQIDIRNVNHSLYLYNNKYNLPYELLYVNERIKIGTKTYQNQDREADWIAFSMQGVEPDGGLRDQNGNRIGIEYNSTGELIPFPNGEVISRYNLGVAAPWDEYVTMGFWSTLIGKGIALWDAPGSRFGGDSTKFGWWSDQQAYWTRTGENRENYVSQRNGAPETSEFGIRPRLWASSGDAAYAGNEAAWRIRNRTTTLSHGSYSSSKGNFVAVSGDAGLHLNGFGVLNKNLFVVKDAYDAKKGIALVGTGSEGMVLIYYNGFLSPHEFEDNVTINGINLGRVYGRQTVVKTL